MITIKLPIQLSESVKNIQKQYSSVVRWSYNRLMEQKNQKEIRQLSKSLNNIELLDSWLIQCGIMEAKAIKTRNKDKTVIFGGRLNFKKRSQQKITKEEFLEKRILPINSQGERLYYGNRKFDLKIIENNEIIFKLNKNYYITIQLPKLRKNYKKKLYKFQQLAEKKEITYSVKLSDKFIWISFENFDQKEVKQVKNRIFGVDLNPTEIGWSALEFDTENNYKVINRGIIKLDEKLTKKLGVSSSSKEQKYQNNKREFEVYEILKFLVGKAEHYQCSKFVVEDLKIKQSKYNRLVNNIWNLGQIYTNLEKRLKINKIKLVKINPAYSSFVGNIINNNYPDPISASIEVGRRGYKKFEKGWFYPKFDVEDLKNGWKDDLDLNRVKDWKQLFKVVKNSKLRYRVSLDNFVFKVFSLKHKRSLVENYVFC